MIKNILIDVDGVLWHGGKQINGAQATIGFLERKKYNFLFLTNISRYTRKDLSRKLQLQGISAVEERIMTPIETTIDFIKSKKQNALCYLISDKNIKEQFKASGLRVVEKEKKVDFVVLFLYEKMNYAMLDTAFRALLGGAEFVANTDLKFGAFKDQKPSLATGPFIKALEYACGKKAILTGKPNRLFFKQALKKLRAKPAQTLMVGDNISTDVIGAKSVGAKVVLVKTGGYNKEEFEKSVIKPDAVIDSIASLPGFLENYLVAK